MSGTYGLQVWDWRTGNKILDTTDYVARLVAVETVSGSGTKYIPEADGKMSFAVSYPVTEGESVYYPIYAQMGLEGWDGVLRWWLGADYGETLVYVYVLE